MLYGPDPFESLSVQTADLHHQLEFELRSKLVQMQQRFFAIGRRGQSSSRIAGTVPLGHTALFRATLRVLDEKVPEQRREFGSLWKNIFPLMWRRSITFCCFERNQHPR